MNRKQATTAQIAAYAAQVAAQFPTFKVNPNGYGVRVECNTCHTSATFEPEKFASQHTC